MALLSSRFQLFDVDDVEALVVTAITRSRHTEHLTPDERDDVVAAGITAVWRASTRYDAARGKFSTFAYGVAQRAAIDEVRRLRGRTVWRFSTHTYERSPVDLVSFDGLDEAIAERSGDPAAAGDADLARLVDERRRSRSEDLATLRRGPARRAA